MSPRPRGAFSHTISSGMSDNVHPSCTCTQTRRRGRDAITFLCNPHSGVLRCTQWSCGGRRGNASATSLLSRCCVGGGAFRVLPHVRRSTMCARANKTPAFAHPRLSGSSFNGLTAELRDPRSHARTHTRSCTPAQAGGCLA